MYLRFVMIVIVIDLDLQVTLELRCDEKLRRRCALTLPPEKAAFETLQQRQHCEPN
jgi:hypothetical protein